MSQAAHVEGLYIVRYGGPVHIGRKAIVTHVAGEERPQLRSVRTGPIDELGDGGYSRVSACHISRRRGDIYIIQRCEVIEVKDMRLNVVRPLDQVADYAAVIRYLISDSKGAVKA